MNDLGLLRVNRNYKRFSPVEILKRLKPCWPSSCLQPWGGEARLGIPLSSVRFWKKIQEKKIILSAEKGSRG